MNFCKGALHAVHFSPKVNLTDILTRTLLQGRLSRIYSSSAG